MRDVTWLLMRSVDWAVDEEHDLVIDEERHLPVGDEECDSPVDENRDPPVDEGQESCLGSQMSSALFVIGLLLYASMYKSMVVDSNGMQELGYPVRACSRVLKEHVLELLKSMTLRRNKYLGCFDT